MATTLVVMNMLNQRSYAVYGPHNDGPDWVGAVVVVVCLLAVGGLLYAACSSVN